MLGLCLLVLRVTAWSPILLSLEDMQFQAGDEILISLSTFIVGSNLTFAVDGNFTTPDGMGIPDLPPPEIYQRVANTTEIPKAQQGLSRGGVGFVQDPGYSDIYYDAVGNQVYAWDLSTHRVRNSFAVSGTVVGLYVESGGGSATILVLSYRSQQLIFEMAFCTPDIEFIPDVNFKVYFPIASFPAGAHIERRKTSIYAYVWGLDSHGTGILTLYKVSLGVSVVKLSSITAASMSLPTFSPVSFTTFDTNGIVCDRELGVLLIGISNWLRFNQPPKLLGLFKDPGYYGEILGCELVNDYLYVTTQSSQLVYGLSELPFGGGYQTDLVYAFTPAADQETREIVAVSGTIVSEELGIVVSLLQYANCPETYLRVLNINAEYYGNGFITLDQSLCASLSDDTCHHFPAFTIFPYESERAIIVIDGMEGLSILELWIYAELLVSAPLTTTYMYTGEVEVTVGDAVVVRVPISLTAWDVTGSTIYTTRNTVPSDGYVSQVTITHKLNSRDGLNTDIYLPLSNYFSGQLIDYEVTLQPNAPSYVTLTYPEPISLDTADYSFPLRDSVPYMSMLQFSGYTLLAALNNNAISLFNAITPESLTPITTFPASQSGYRVTQCAVVIELFSSLSWLVIESEKEEMYGYGYLWDIYNLTSPLQPVYSITVMMQSLTPFGKMQGKDNLLFSLRVDSIVVGEIKVVNGGVTFVQIPSITGNSVHINRLQPTDFSVDFGDDSVYVYDYHHGLIRFEVGMDGYYIGNISGIAVSSDPTSVRLCLHDSLIMVFDPAKSHDTVTDYSYDFYLTGSFPLLDDTVYLSAFVAYHILAIIAVTDSSGEGILLFDRAAVPYRGLIAFLPISKSALVVPVEGDLYFVYGYDGEVLSRWKVGQQDSDWLPNSPFVPAYSMERTVWAKVTFSFYTLINEPMYQVDVYLTAISGLSGLTNSTTISITLNNTGSYIRKSPAYDSSSPLFSHDPLSIANSTTVLPIPNDYFLGNDIAFAFILNENVGLPLQPQVICDPESALVCISTKEHLCLDCMSLPSSMPHALHFLMTDNYTYFTAYNLVIQQKTANSSDFVSFHIDEMRHATVAMCYLLADVEGDEALVVVACVEMHSAYSGQFLMVLNSTDVEKSMFFEISTMVTSIEATLLEDGGVMIFASDFSRVMVIASQGNELVLSSVISDASLNLNTFYPTSLEYFNTTYLFVGDESVGLFVLNRINETSQYTTKQVIRGFQGYNESGVAAVSLSPDLTSLYVLSKSTSLYVFDLGPDMDLTLRMIIDPVADDLEMYIVNDVLAIDRSGRFVAFPFYDGVDCRVRVLDLSAKYPSQILTSTDSIVKGIPAKANIYGNVEIYDLQPDGSFTLTVLLNFAFAVPLFHSYTIHPNSTAYIFPQENFSPSNKQISLQLEAVNSLSKSMAPNMTVIFTEANETMMEMLQITGKAGVEVYETWWFWVVVGWGVTGVVTVLFLFVLWYTGRKKKPTRRLTEMTNLSSIHSSVSVTSSEPNTI